MHFPHYCGLVAFLAIVSLSEVESRVRRDPYHVYSLDNACPRSGGKREIKLRTGAAIFILNEMNSEDTQRHLKDNSISCHLEVEAPSGFGFHVFMEELSLDEEDQRCQDYIQFGRDVLYITTKKSAKFCGQRNALDFHDMTPAKSSKVAEQGQRWYVEDRDNEMDIWIKIGQNTIGDGRGRPGQPAWRKIVLVVTVFKRSCGQRDLFYKQCKHTSHCIRKDFFCDLRANCAWPNGEEAADEKDCDQYLAGTYAMKSSFLKPSSIPVFLIVAILISVGMAGIVIALRRLIIGVQSSESYSEVVTSSVPVHETHAGMSLSRADPVEASAPPPSYEDAIKNSQEGAGRSDKPPPPYTESDQ